MHPVTVDFVGLSDVNQSAVNLVSVVIVGLFYVDYADQNLVTGDPVGLPALDWVDLDHGAVGFVSLFNIDMLAVCIVD